MHDSQRDSLRDLFFYAGHLQASIQILECPPYIQQQSVPSALVIFRAATDRKEMKWE